MDGKQIARYDNAASACAAAPLSATHLSYATSDVSLCTPLLAALVLLAACHPHQQKALPPVPVTAGTPSSIAGWGVARGLRSRDSTRREDRLQAEGRQGYR